MLFHAIIIQLSHEIDVAVAHAVLNIFGVISRNGICRTCIYVVHMLHTPTRDIRLRIGSSFLADS